MTISNDTVNWIFENILLLDSTSSEPLSHGVVRFNIKQKENNDQGTVITNKAGIYFDFNDPIITNEVTSIVDNLLVTSLKNKKTNNSLNIYPNPAQSMININLDEEGVFTLFK